MTTTPEQRTNLKAAAEAALDCGQTLEIDPRDWLALEARVASAEGALRPFADTAEAFIHYTSLLEVPDPDRLVAVTVKKDSDAVSGEIRVSHLRTARAHFQSQGGDHGRD